MGDVERRVVEAHATLEKMRNDFELEREGYAVTERDLRARLTTETEQREALEAAQQSLQEYLEALRAQNSVLLEGYASARRLSEEFVEGARGLASAFEKPLPDVPPVPDVPAPKSSSKTAKKVSAEDQPDPADEVDDSTLEDGGDPSTNGQPLQAGSRSQAKA
jgi:hypothetical protein